MSNTTTDHTWYYKVFHFVAAERLRRNDTDIKIMHTILMSVIVTSIIMWGYTYLAIEYMNTKIPAIFGIILSAIHLISPFMLRFTNNTYFVSNSSIACIFIMQTIFTYFAGGFTNFGISWFGLLPLLGAFMYGRKSVYTWFTVTLISSLVLLGLSLKGHPFPIALSSRGSLIALALTQFAWIFLGSALMLIYIKLRENSEALVNEQKEKIDALFRVLFHDLANPLGRIGIGLSIAKRGELNEQTVRGIQIAQEATICMQEVTQNVRNMYALSKNKAHIDLIPTCLNDSVFYVQKLFSEDLKHKNISLLHDFDKTNGLCLMVEPVSFKNQVMANIISNAIKFSYEGGQITISVLPMEDQLFMVEISDDGIGMPDCLVPDLFDINKKTSRPGTNGEHGTGFGMHIMKSFVEMYGGKVSVKSKDLNVDKRSGTKIGLVLKGQWT